MSKLSAAKKVVKIPNKLGLHARAASKMARLARQARSIVWVMKDNQKADASSVLDILMLACPQGTNITVGIDDPIDEPVFNEIVSLIEDGFGE